MSSDESLVLAVEFSLDRYYLLQEGFLYHHAEPHYLMLVYWIPETLSSIPANASHRLRVGAIVLNNNKEVLCHHPKRWHFFVK